MKVDNTEWKKIKHHNEFYEKQYSQDFKKCIHFYNFYRPIMNDKQKMVYNWLIKASLSHKYPSEM